MNIVYKIILLLALSQVFLFFTHVAVERIISKKKEGDSPLIRAMKCALFGNIPVLLAAMALTAKGAPAGYSSAVILVYVFLVYNAMAYSYCHVFNMGDTARRIRILHELDRAGGRIARDELDKRYGIRNMLDARLERLVSMRQITEHGGRFVISSSLLYRAGLIVLRWGFFLNYKGPLRRSLKDAGLL
ncbi:MAG: hypothetical protein ABIH74_06435 [Candidatus Omnitrophota bacterium]